MACRGCLEFLFKLVNFLLTLAGLVIVAFGIYLFVEFARSPGDNGGISSSGYSPTTVQLGRPMLIAVSLSNNFMEELPKAWFIYAFIGVGVIIFVISCFGCVGAATRNGCCLNCYAVLVFLLILVELGCAAFIFFDKNWEESIPKDKTGDFDMIYVFLRKHWKIVRWVAVGVIALEVLLFVLTLAVRAANRADEYDSDDEIINARQKQPLLSRPSPAPVATVPHDQRSNRSDAWSARMREKYGLDTAEFTYNPSESNRHQQTGQQNVEDRSRCTIM